MFTGIPWTREFLFSAWCDHRFCFPHLKLNQELLQCHPKGLGLSSRQKAQKELKKPCLIGLGYCKISNGLPVVSVMHLTFGHITPEKSLFSCRPYWSAHSILHSWKSPSRFLLVIHLDIRCANHTNWMATQVVSGSSNDYFHSSARTRRSQSNGDTTIRRAGILVSIWNPVKVLSGGFHSDIRHNASGILVKECKNTLVLPPRSSALDSARPIKRIDWPMNQVLRPCREDWWHPTRLLRVCQTSEPHWHHHSKPNSDSRFTTIW